MPSVRHRTRNTNQIQKETLELLLEYKHKKDTINAVIIQLGNGTHSTYALELCDPRVVCRLLEMGGNPMTRAQIENITVLYRWAALLTWVNRPSTSSPHN